MKWRIVSTGAIAACAAMAGISKADDEQPEVDAVAAPAEIATAVRGGAMLPLTLAPGVGGAAAVALGFAGYDGARAAPIGTAIAEVRIWGPFAIRGSADYSDVRKQLRPTIGGRAQFLRQERHGVDGSLSVFYRPEGFTEAEGEIESLVSVGRRFGRYSVLGNLVYGQDPEGHERDGEIRAAALGAFGRWTLGLDSRFRFAIGSQQTAMARAEPRFDLFGGPVAGAVVGPLAFFAQAGPSVLKLGGAASMGVATLAGVGSAF